MIFSPLLQEPFFSLSKFFLGGNYQTLSNLSTTKFLAIGRQLAVFHKPFLGSSYSELEQSLGFEPPSWTASQVRLPLSGRAEWAGELVKCCKCYVTMKIMHILCLLCSRIHIKLSAHAEMEFHCIHCDMKHRKHRITSRSREESKRFALKHAAFCDLLRALLSILV